MVLADGAGLETLGFATGHARAGFRHLVVSNTAVDSDPVDLCSDLFELSLVLSLNFKLLLVICEFILDVLLGSLGALVVPLNSCFPGLDETSVKSNAGSVGHLLGGTGIILKGSLAVLDDKCWGLTSSGDG